jgi:hypothetical protein
MTRRTATRMQQIPPFSWHRLHLSTTCTLHPPHQPPVMISRHESSPPKKNRLSCALKPPKKGRRHQSHVSFFRAFAFSHITALHRRSRKGARNGTLKQGLFSLFLRHSPRRSPSRFISGAGALHPLERGHSSPIERLRHDGHARCGTKTKNSPSRWSARP